MEPAEHADRLRPVVPGLVRWGVAQRRIGGARGESYAILSGEGQILVDPLPLTPAALERLAARGPVRAIVLTIQSHQRSAWRYRRRFQAPVYAPSGSQGLDERPDHAYRAGGGLPGGLRAMALPGPAFSEHGILWRSPAGTVAFVGDLVTRAGRELSFVPDRYMDSPGKARASVRELARRRIDVLCPGHGAPLLGAVKARLERLLAADARGHG
ncbi:MAG TPA: MBL fold metallo-hydrolase [Myxococcales bacterium]|nr:MBL fold metallo-hydrolase [Myxococcales bacterium]